MEHGGCRGCQRRDRDNEERSQDPCGFQGDRVQRVGRVAGRGVRRDLGPQRTRTRHAGRHQCARQRHEHDQQRRRETCLRGNHKQQEQRALATGAGGEHPRLSEPVHQRALDWSHGRIGQREGPNRHTSNCK